MDDLPPKNTRLFGIFFTEVGVEFEQEFKNKNKNMFEVEVSEVIFSQQNSLEVHD